MNYQETTDDHTFIMTFGGEARSGKGTSVAALSERLQETGYTVRVIDQGIKFRALAELALGTRQAMDDQFGLTDFMRKDATKNDLFALLSDISTMSETDKKSLLYRPSIGAASAQIGRVPEAHEIALGYLHDEVKQAAEDAVKVVLIDGRAMEKYGKKFHEEGLARFVMGWYFRCDAAVAGRRSLGMMADHANMSVDERLELLTEILRISDRNRSDAMRDVDPMIEPTKALRIDLSTFGTAEHESGNTYKSAYSATHQYGIALVDTSYTHTVEQMTKPVLDVSMHALMFHRAVTHEAAGIKTLVL